MVAASSQLATDSRGVSACRDGCADIAALGKSLADRLPAPLRPLAPIACNYWWSWAQGGAELFTSLDPARWERIAGPEYWAAAGITAATNGRLETKLLRNADGVGDVGHAATSGDQRRPFVDQAIVNGSGFFVGRVARLEELS